MGVNRTLAPVWFPFGSRLGIGFGVIDDELRIVESFVRALAPMLESGGPVEEAVRAAGSRYPAALEMFEVASDGKSFQLRDEYTFPGEWRPRHLTAERMGLELAMPLHDLLARDVRELIALTASARHSAEEVRSLIDPSTSALFEALLRTGVAMEAPAPAPVPPPVGPAVVRLQHAGLWVTGRRATVLIDPHFNSHYEPTELASNMLRPHFEGRVDAILITHAHADHLHLPTLMSFSPDTAIIVPRVTEPTMLSPNLVTTLHSLGFYKCRALGWWEPPVTIGDIEVHALPFYGEQPLLREPPRHPALRNHGNTYLLQIESTFTWVLADSGTDWQGATVDVADAVRARFGPVSLVLSNLRRFASSDPTYVAGGLYWLALSVDQMRRFASMSQDILTLGPSGVAEVCRRVSADRVLPYAHWWGQLGTVPSRREDELIGDLINELASRSTSTEVVAWRIGDAARLAGGPLRPCFR